MHQYQERDREEDKGDLESLGLKEEYVLDTTKWKNDIYTTIPVTPGEKEEERSHG